jgi:hypothetical protein
LRVDGFWETVEYDFLCPMALGDTAIDMDFGEQRDSLFATSRVL